MPTLSSRVVCLDTETTGLKPQEGHRVIEIGGIEIVNRRITGRHFHTYLNPGRSIDAGAQAVHGITQEFLLDKPVFIEIADEFVNFIEGAELVIHNAPFDVGFLNPELKLCAPAKLPLHEYCKITDSLEIARSLHLGQKNSLDKLCERYGIDLVKERALHGALLDAKLLALVILAMTGGQGELFNSTHKHGEKESVANHKLSHPRILRDSDSLLRVIQANTEELHLHQSYLENMT